MNISRVSGPTGFNYNVVARLGLPVITNQFEAIAAAYESQDPAAYLPKNTHPTVIAGYKVFQNLHAKQFRKKNVNKF
jgi:choline dehydrogenase